jgi:threonylcarbamoyladenosine tRNA methylthiotransferase MtaB
MPDSVPLNERKKRNKLLRTLSAKKIHYFYQNQLNKNFKVLFEHESKNDFMFGFTENYVKVSHPYQANLVNKTVDIKTLQINEDGLVNIELTSVLEAIH